MIQSTISMFQSWLYNSPICTGEIMVKHAFSLMNIIILSSLQLTILNGNIVQTQCQMLGSIILPAEILLESSNHPFRMLKSPLNRHFPSFPPCKIIVKLQFSIIFPCKIMVKSQVSLTFPSQIIVKSPCSIIFPSQIIVTSPFSPVTSSFLGSLPGKLVSLVELHGLGPGQRVRPHRHGAGLGQARAAERLPQPEVGAILVDDWLVVIYSVL